MPIDSRGKTILENQFDKQNLILVKGCKPGMGVKSDTKLIEDLANCLKDKYDKDNLAIVFPSIIDLLKGSDANIEIIKSSQLQTLRLQVKPLIAKQKIAYIFVMTHIQRDNLKPIIWNDAEKRAAAVSECFKRDLKYDVVQIHKNLSKLKVLEKLKELHEISK